VSGNTTYVTDVPLDEFSRLLHPFNATLVTCQEKNGPPNALAIAWIMPVSLNPPTLVFAIRKERYSYKLLEQAREFVVNMPGFDLARQVLYCGRKSGKDVDKFEKTGLTAGKARKVSVPIVNECVAHIECRVAETIPKGDHVLVIGKVLAAYVKKEAFKGVYDLKRFKPLLYLGDDVFTTTSTETIEPEAD
jgi:flavin reductase (DIM6/NTAB) family NADH-FMN oxidoreductase RutF